MAISRNRPAPPMSYRTYSQAAAALVQLRREGHLEGMVVKIVESPFGYQIKKTPADLQVDQMAAGIA